MNSSIMNITDILEMAEELESTGFSDGYNFDEVNAADYLIELIENSQGSDSIFSGILIMEKDCDELSDYTIMDGLQRITTICLLLIALCANYKNTSKLNSKTCNEIFERYLVSKNLSKLSLAGSDAEIYKKILFSMELSEWEKNQNIALAYNGFLEQIKASNISGNDLFKIISNMRFMSIIVEKSEIPPRELYQTLNKKEDSQMNLISDFITQRASDNVIFMWQKIFNSFKQTDLTCSFEDFIRDFLTVQNGGKIPKKNALYNNFKSYFSKMLKYKDSVKISKYVLEYCGYYLKIHNADFDDVEVKTKIVELNENNGKDAYPYLMEVLDDYENWHIDKTMFLDILDMVNNFVKNRLENPESEKVVDFATLSAELNKTLLEDYNSDSIAEESKITINELSSL